MSLQELNLHSLGFWTDCVQGLWMWKCMCLWFRVQKTSWMLISRCPCLLLWKLCRWTANQWGEMMTPALCASQLAACSWGPGLGNTLLLLKEGWAGNHGGIPNPESGCLGQILIHLGHWTRWQREEGERRYRAKSRPGKLGKTRSRGREENGRRSWGIWSLRADARRDILGSWTNDFF